MTTLAPRGCLCCSGHTSCPPRRAPRVYLRPVSQTATHKSWNSCNHATGPRTTRAERRGLLRVQAASVLSEGSDSGVAPLATDAEEDNLGPAALHALDVLGWRELCAEVERFASTVAGREAVRRMLPGRSSAKAEGLLAETVAVDAIEALHGAALQFGGVETGLAVPALRRAEAAGLLSGAELLAVASVLAGAGRLARSVLPTVERVKREAGVESRTYQALRPLEAVFKGLPTCPDLLERIRGSLEEDGAVKSTASEEVRSARVRVQTLRGRVESVVRGRGASGDVTEYKGRMCLAVPGDAGAVAARKGLVLGSSVAGGVVYFEPQAAVPGNNQLVEAVQEMRDAEESFMWSLSGQVMGSADSVRQCLEAVVWLDAACARARFGRWLLCVPPERAEWGGIPGRAVAKARKTGQKQAVSEPYLALQLLRHPLLAARHKRWSEQAAAGGGERSLLARLREQGVARPTAEEGPNAGSGPTSNGEEGAPPAPVPCDVTVRLPTRAVVITGPNTGGKTAVLKALGLAVLMSQAGLFVPARSARLAWFEGVYADIGDSQSLSASLSTFSGHLRRIHQLRCESGNRSLVLLDELGTGTDPAEGAALGVALLRRMATGGPGGAGLTVATTHMALLTSLKYQDDRFENASVEFDEVSLRPTYRLLWGVPGRSNAVNIAARLGLDAGVVAAARERLGDAHQSAGAMVAELEALRARAMEDEAEAEAAKAALAEERALLASAEATKRAEWRKAEQRAVRAIGAHVRGARAALGGGAAAGARVTEAATPAPPPPSAPPREWLPRVGDVVLVPRLKGRGEVVGVSARGVEVQVGPVRAVVRRDEVQRA